MRHLINILEVRPMKQPKFNPNLPLKDQLDLIDELESYSF